MQPTLQYELLRRIAAHHAAGTTDARGQARAFDARVYTDDKHLRGEADTLFRRFPVRVGFTAELKVPGETERNSDGLSVSVQASRSARLLPIAQ